MFSSGSRGGGNSAVAPPSDSVKGYLFAHKHEMESYKESTFSIVVADFIKNWSYC